MVCHVLHVFVWKVAVVAMLANVLKDEQITNLLKDVLLGIETKLKENSNENKFIMIMVFKRC
jgi:hypothetical protein